MALLPAALAHATRQLGQCWALVTLAFAGTSAQAMDLMQAYQAALRQDATVQASRAAADAGRERLPQARALLGPTLSASLLRSKNDLTSTAPDLFGRAQTSALNYFSGNKAVTLRQPLYRPAQWASFRQAEAYVDEVNANLDKDLHALAVRVTGAYFEVLLADDQLNLVLASKTTYTTQLDAARKALVAGSGTRMEIDEAQAKVDIAAAQELEARQSQDYARRQLGLLVNAPIHRLAPLDWVTMPLLAPTPARLEDWVEQAELRSPEILALRAQLQAARHEVDKAQAAHLPSLDATAQWARSESENVLNVRSRYDNTALSVQLNIPIYAGGYVNSMVRQALAEHDRVEAMTEATRRDLGLRVHKEYRNITEGILRVQALAQAARSAEQLVVSSRKSFQAGSRTQLDILNAEQQRMLTLRDLAQARYVYLLSRVRLHALAGADKQSSIEEVNRWLQAETPPDRQ